MTLIWWWLAHRATSGHAPRLQRGLRVTAALFALFHITSLGVIIGSRVAGVVNPMPAGLLVPSYVWFFLVVPFVLVPIVVWRAAGETMAWWAGRRAKVADVPVVDAMEEDDSPVLTRRQLVLATAVVAPPLVNVIGTGRALAALDDFRIRRLEVEVAGLPEGLDGVRIAHLSDTHIGKFTHGRVLDSIARAANELKPDLTLITGDIIDNSLSVMPEAVAFLKRLEAEHGVWMCEGNHDLFESREGFEQGLKSAGLNLLVNETAVVRPRGIPLEIVGMAWGMPDSRRPAYYRENLKAALATSSNEATTRVVLSHHPHVAEYAAKKGMPLVLSGHTHGGQLMLSPNVGVGPMMFRFWSGLYQVDSTALVVSNGVGNWFPLRIGAPAEILDLTLRAPRTVG